MSIPEKKDDDKRVRVLVEGLESNCEFGEGHVIRHCAEIGGRDLKWKTPGFGDFLKIWRE